MKYRKELLEELTLKAQQLRKDVVLSIGVGVAGHVGGSCSAADIVAALYFYKMKYDPKNPQMPDRDRFLLSKGHVAILQYSALAEAGFFPVEDLKTTKEIGSYLQGHPDVRKTPGIEAGTGSLGQGLSIHNEIVEGMDLYQDDIRNTFTDSYVGKYVNDYDNKQLFVAAVRAYQAGLAGEVLDASYDNTASVDAQAQKQYLQERGQDVSQMTETEILTANTGAKVFIASHVKFVDAMEDLQMTVNM